MNSRPTTTTTTSLPAGSRGASDGELLGRFADAGDQQAFAEIVRRHGPMVVRQCRRLGGTAAAAHTWDDAAQEVFLMLANRAGALRTRTSVAGWLYRAAWNVLSHARRELRTRRRHEREAAADVLAATGARGNGVPFAVVTEELGLALTRALGSLPEAYRDAVVLHHVAGHSVEETADVLGEPVGTVASRLSRARGMLRAALDGWGLPVTAGVVTLWLEQQAEAALPAASGFDAPAFAGAVPAGAGAAAGVAAGAAGSLSALSAAVAAGAAAVTAGAGAPASIAFGLSRRAAAAALPLFVMCGAAAAATPVVLQHIDVRAAAQQIADKVNTAAPTPERGGYGSLRRPESSGGFGSSQSVPEPAAGAVFLVFAGQSLLARRRRPPADPSHPRRDA